MLGGVGCGDAFALGREVPDRRLFPDWEGSDSVTSRTCREHDTCAYAVRVSFEAHSFVRRALEH